MKTPTPVNHIVPNINKKALILEIILKISTSTLCCCLLLWKELAYSAGLDEWDDWMGEKQESTFCEYGLVRLLPFG